MPPEKEYLFTRENGATFTAEKFLRQVWTRALTTAGVKYRKPYTTRHSFAAWALAIRCDQNRLANLMGHASKQMIYEVYGRYLEGVEQDRLKILAYFGRDFKRGWQKSLDYLRKLCESLYHAFWLEPAAPPQY
ncbi:tyrosine-type recombinase/integrase [Oryzomonas rubra]|uniref:tyrosine-type recombinase/integrase n=1 Tax=Oryzomonas rubra TaxID=2509454 RepID=UPI001FE4AE19|nr:tyrosine-type recombinase/integrase [Oryzomonas rubra]